MLMSVIALSLMRIKRCWASCVDSFFRLGGSTRQPLVTRLEILQCSEPLAEARKGRCLAIVEFSASGPALMRLLVPVPKGSDIRDATSWCHDTRTENVARPKQRSLMLVFARSCPHHSSGWKAGWVITENGLHRRFHSCTSSLNGEARTDQMCHHGGTSSIDDWLQYIALTEAGLGCQSSGCSRGLICRYIEVSG